MARRAFRSGTATILCPAAHALRMNMAGDRRVRATLEHRAGEMHQAIEEVASRRRSRPAAGEIEAKGCERATGLGQVSGSTFIPGLVAPSALGTEPEQHAGYREGSGSRTQMATACPRACRAPIGRQNGIAPELTREAVGGDRHRPEALGERVGYSRRPRRPARSAGASRFADLDQVFSGRPRGTRTPNPLIKSQLLYQLS